ncbi:NADPH-dependent aldehyde reductase-like protein, chloroplastic [Senna tora]|uniref:NADPH-dependent aldehyde reductase-like protein, chloroplastic n=1 Tax=Senna tora TaxID=362788 RepID=A0A834T571_9FABA|nr:NADPH-dependent aldehyde reductase-like protein, chloroplastic [Senna tora]
MAMEIQSGSLQDRVAIVTGSSRGIGRGIALHLASLGARIVVSYTTNVAQAESVAAQINTNSSGGPTPRAIAVRTDITDPTLVKTLFDEAERAFNSPVHILVNSAGFLDTKFPPIAQTPLEDFDHTFSVNARGAFLCCKEAAQRLKRGGGGRIIMLSSSQMGVLSPGFGAYTAAKAAVETMVKILAKELKGTGITANCVAPGPIATEIGFDEETEKHVKATIEWCPLGRIGEAKDVGSVVGFLASDGGEWVNGQVIRLNGGLV